MEPEKKSPEPHSAPKSRYAIPFIVWSAFISIAVLAMSSSPGGGYGFGPTALLGILAWIDILVAVIFVFRAFRDKLAWISLGVCLLPLLASVSSVHSAGP